MLRHLWRHDIWIIEKLKFDYLKNVKSFRSEKKTTKKPHFPLFHKSSLLDIQNKLAKIQRTQPLNWITGLHLTLNLPQLFLNQFPPLMSNSI